MKQFITLIALIFVFSATTFAQTEKTLIKSVPVEALTAATIELPGEVNVSNWDKDFIRVTATVRVGNTTESILKRLVMVGRYELNTNEDKNGLTLSMPKVEQTVIIKGVNLEEVIDFEVQVPVGMKAMVKQPDFYQVQQSM